MEQLLRGWRCAETRGWPRLLWPAPPVRMRPCDYRLAVRPGIRGRLQSVRGVCESLNLTAMNLTTIRPCVPRENILLMEGIHDLLCPKDDIEDLWQSWGQPDIWRLPYGHVRVCCGGVPVCRDASCAGSCRDLINHLLTEPCRRLTNRSSEEPHRLAFEAFRFIKRHRALHRRRRGCR